MILYSLRIKSPYRVLCSSLVLFLVTSSAILLILSAISLHSLPPIFWYGIKIYSRIFFSVFLALAWTFIDQYHDLQDAKRVYSLYSAAYFSGLVLSGFCIHLFLEIVGTRLFFALSALCVLLSLREARTIAYKIPAVHDDSVEGVFSGDRHSFSSTFLGLIQSPYTIALLALSLIQEFTLTTTEFNYMETFASAFQQGELQKTCNANTVSEFLGKCRALISIANVLIGGFLYRPFVKRLGLTNLILFPPFFFFLIFTGWVFDDSITIAILGLIAVDGVAFTIEDNSFNLLTKAVPSKIKSKVRIVNDSFFEPIGMMVSAACLFFLQSSQSKQLGLVLSIGLISITFLLRSLYKKALFLNLKEQILRFEKTVKDWICSWNKKERKLAKEVLSKRLSSTQESEKILAIKAILRLEEPALIRKIASALLSLSNHGKSEALDLLEKVGFSEDPTISHVVQTWADPNSSLEFQQKAYFYLAKRNLLPPKNLLHHLDESHSLWIRASAIITLQKYPSSSTLDELALHKTIAERETALMLNDEDEKEVLMGLLILQEIPTIQSAEKALSLSTHPSLQIRRAAAKALASIANDTMYGLSHPILSLLQETPDSIARLQYLKALGHIADSSTVKKLLLTTTHFRPLEKRETEKILAAMGLKNIPIILSVLKDTKAHDKPRILASKVLARLSIAQLQASLQDILEVEKERAYFYFYYGHTVQASYPEYDLSDLTQTLLTSFQSAVDFIIHVLGAVGQVEDPELLVISLHSKNAKVHSSAIEALETSCDPYTFSWILPLIEDLPFEEKIAAYKKYTAKDHQLTLEEILQKLQSSPSTFDRIVATKLKAHLRTPLWAQEVKKQLKTCEEPFHHFAYELLEHETT